MQKVKLNDIVELDIKRMGINGEGIGYFERLAVFIDNALPGEKVIAQISEIFPNRAHAKVLKTIISSPNRVKPICPVYDACGGCQVQHFDYHAMLEQKKDIIKKALDRYVDRYNPNKIEDTTSLPFKFINGKNRFGMYARNSNDFVPIKTCGVQHTLINDIFTTMTKLMDKHKIHAYNDATNEGDISHAVVRIAQNTHEVQVSLIRPIIKQDLKVLIDELVDLHKEIVSVYDVINPDIRQNFYGSNINLIYGKPMIEENLDGHTFSLSPEAFFQLNTEQATKFYHQMKALADIKDTDIVIDAYAGIAPISHYIGHDAKHIYAIEINKEVAHTAKLLLEQNNIHNVTVIQNDFEVALEQIKDQHIDVVLFDLPRSGLTEQALKTILKYKPKKIVYGSCNPSTLAKDLSHLLEDYKLKTIVPIDMFPYTSLVESITLLELR